VREKIGILGAATVLCTLSGVANAEFSLPDGDGWTSVSVASNIQSGSALDFSSFRTTGAPAGKYGRLVAKGSTFEFEGLPGVPQRFYGVNLCGSANFPSHQESDRLCAYLAAIGYNSVRIHHHDTFLVKEDGSLEPNEAAFDRLDYLIAACISNGLYITTDLYVSRRVPYRMIGIDKDGVMPHIEFKELVPVNRRAYENFIAFARLFLGHENAYTGRRYADEPALAWVAFVNEGNLGNRGTERFKAYPEWIAAWREWLDEKSRADPSFASIPHDIPERFSMFPSSPDRVSSAFLQFLADVEDRFDKRVSRFFKEEMKCQALTANMSSWMFPASYQVPRTANFDYVDDHFYIDHPIFDAGHAWRLPSTLKNANPLRDAFAGVPVVAVRRALDKPFTVSEFNYSGPGRFRGLGGIVAGTIAALQGWSGMWRFAWSHSIGGVAHPESRRIDYFDLAGDPLLLASERATVCLYLRGDLTELRESYGVLLDPASFTGKEDYPCGNDAKWRWAGWYRKIGSIVSPTRPKGVRFAGSGLAGFMRRTEDVRMDIFGSSDTNFWPIAGDGKVRILPSSGSFAVSTPCTAGGFAESGGFSAGFMRVAGIDVPATIWASSLDGRPAQSSKRILLTHLTDVQNTGIAYADETRVKLLKWGALPHIMRKGTCMVSLLLKPGNWKVYALAADGRRRRELPVACTDGELKINLDIAADGSSASYLYEILGD